jgi:hypothetical protein
MNGLFCPDTLRAAFRTARESDMPAREGIKELLTPNSPNSSAAAEAHSASMAMPEFARWERCLELLVEEFLTRKFELLKLNKARREKIEEFIRERAKIETTLENAVQSRLGSPEHEALQLFAHQVCVFHLLQVLLLKRWVDRDLVSAESLKLSGQTLNWQITSFLKKNSRNGMMQRHDWSFLKQNLFSWYSPTRETWERLRLLLEPANLAVETGDFPARLLRSLGSHTRLSLLGFTPSLIDSGALWRLLLEQKAFDLRLDSVDQLDIASETSGPVLLSGLRNGESLNSLRELARGKELHGAWAFTNSDFERYLSEMFILWECASEIPRINIHPRPLLKELSRDVVKATSFFGDGMRMPYQAHFGACFQDGEGDELEDVSYLLDQLKENGLLLISSDVFWPTDSDAAAERLRDAVLRKASLRLIVDLRQLTGNGGERIPKGVYLLEKCSSKELRDSNRPQILRARGHLQPQSAQATWGRVIESIRHETSPGEVSVKTFDGVRLESMAAAASQQELRSSPWITLSDPAFYEASGRLRRNPSKAFTIGTIMRWKDGMQIPSQRGLVFQEHSKNLLAGLPGESSIFAEDTPRYLLLPEASVVEQPAFFVAQVLSAPVQFWYRLELEQNIGKRQKQIERQSEQRLKLMPLIRLFEPGTLLPAPSALKAIESIDEVRHQLMSIFRQATLGMNEKSRLHQIVLSLEHSVRQSLEVCSDFSRHLFPELTIQRSNIPATLPDLSPKMALDIFRHLDHSPILQHPAIHQARLRQAHDFKVTNCSFEESAVGAMGELKIFHGIDAVIKLSGPSLLLKAAHEEVQRRLGRPWRETAARIAFPTDFMLVQTQLKEVIRSIERQLQATREQLAMLDQIFCCLLGLSPSFTDESVRIAMRRHLSPDDNRVNARFQKEQVFTPAGLEAPTVILQ